MNIYYADYVNNCLKISLMVNIIFNIFVFFILLNMAREAGKYSNLFLILAIFPFGFYIMFRFMIGAPEAKIIRSKKNIDAEIVSAIRSLILDFKANAPMFDALGNLMKNFDEIGKYIKDIVIKVKLGSSLEESLNEIVEIVPSESFRVLLWQIINHLETGTDITNSLDRLADEIVEKQRIDFKKYGKKLNVLSLLYMIVAIILPTIGFTMIAAGLIFMGISMSMSLIMVFWVLFSLLQFVFLAISGGNRPVVEA
ncbi:MAG: type II secretion system F family protein [Nanoarchaeota archaeon]|nr:type II secretion system F family protein [Nanoarchaeota archaeon]